MSPCSMRASGLPSTGTSSRVVGASGLGLLIGYANAMQARITESVGKIQPRSAAGSNEKVEFQNCC